MHFTDTYVKISSRFLGRIQGILRWNFNLGWINVKSVSSNSYNTICYYYVMAIPGRRSILIRSSTVIKNLALGALLLILVWLCIDSLKLNFTLLYFVHFIFPSLLIKSNHNQFCALRKSNKKHLWDQCHGTLFVPAYLNACLIQWLAEHVHPST